MKSLVRFLLFLLFLCVLGSGFVFTVNNTDTVPLWLGIDLPPRPLGLWILLTFSLGAILGLLLGMRLFSRLRDRLELKRLRARVLQMEAELVRLKQELAATDGRER